MEILLEPSWKKELAKELSAPYFAGLMDFVEAAYAHEVVYPPQGQIFAAFNQTPFDKVKVVIIGQDPYHNPNQAHGLAFSVPDGERLPPSLVNIYKELEREYGQPFQGRSGNLAAWARQGVLLLNATLTVAGGANTALSHQGKGWERFTDAAIQCLARRKNLVYMLWGAYAQRKAAFVDRDSNLVLASAHPSPLSAHRGFLGNGHFKACNEYLAAHNLEPINWATI